MQCNNCGNQAPDGATQCPTCSAPLGGAPGQGWEAQSGAGQSGWGDPGPASAPGGYPPPPQSSGWGAGPSGYPAPPAAETSWGTTPTSSNGELAGWWLRVGASLIDAIILFVVNIILGAILGRAAEYGIGLVVGLVYAGVLLSRLGQTVGMMAVGTRCVVARTGGYLSIGAAMGRYLLESLLGITIIGGILDILWPLWDKQNQTIHDKAVGSLIVRTR